MPWCNTIGSTAFVEMAEKPAPDSLLLCALSYGAASSVLLELLRDPNAGAAAARRVWADRLVSTASSRNHTATTSPSTIPTTPTDRHHTTQPLHLACSSKPCASVSVVQRLLDLFEDSALRPMPDPGALDRTGPDVSVASTTTGMTMGSDDSDGGALRAL